MADSPGSPLSSIASDEFAEDVKTEDRSVSVDTYVDHDVDASIERPKKKRRTARGEESILEEPREPSPPDTDVSSDTDGSVPGSPALGVHQDEEAMGAEQITVCKWDGCDAGDLKNMDNLVQHIHDSHIGAKRQRYSCEWGDCARKGTAHASGYALRAHMRSHTREKPFYCLLPECDRSFTRSDALAKHMRTVHETEPPRPSDPIPKHHPSHPSHSLPPGTTSTPTSSSTKPTRLRLVLNNNHNQQSSSSGSGGGGPPTKRESLPPTPTSAAAASGPTTLSTHDAARDPDEEDPSDPNNIAYLPGFHPLTGQAGYMIHWPADIQFSEHEKQMRADQLRQVLRRQLEWAEREREALRQECEGLERVVREEWVGKEGVLENVMERSPRRDRRAWKE
ncbi:hypothetical protein EV356DRAFT_523540 [Viridothelium virens]|uniref:C2H2-type domain-containing protein n=1 Tax=Viridothelium virens TaxID=1048519 RepID=A0A6A6HA38_VIRVR|nr:hypothetical protein EV356DRAFT_523540 [Viridothelium virens]